jgi:hypothetical protein
MSDKKTARQQAFLRLSPVEKWEALKGCFEPGDAPEFFVLRSMTQMVLIENGEERAFTRQTFDALPAAEKSRIGPWIEYVEPPATA